MYSISTYGDLWDTVVTLYTVELQKNDLIQFKLTKICQKYTIGYGISAKIGPLAIKIYHKIDPCLWKLSWQSVHC